MIGGLQDYTVWMISRHCWPIHMYFHGFLKSSIEFHCQGLTASGNSEVASHRDSIVHCSHHDQWLSIAHHYLRAKETGEKADCCWLDRSRISYAGRDGLAIEEAGAAALEIEGRRDDQNGSRKGEGKN